MRRHSSLRSLRAHVAQHNASLIAGSNVDNGNVADFFDEEWSPARATQQADESAQDQYDHLFAQTPPSSLFSLEGERESNPGIGTVRDSCASTLDNTLRRLDGLLRAVLADRPSQDPFADWAKKATLKGLKRDSVIDPSLPPLQILYKLAATRDLLPTLADSSVTIAVLCARLATITRQRMESLDRNAFCGENVVVWLRLLLRAHHMSEAEIGQLLLTEHAERRPREGAAAHLARFEALSLVAGSTPKVVMGRYMATVLKNASWSRLELEREILIQEKLYGRPVLKTPRELFPIVEKLDGQASSLLSKGSGASHPESAVHVKQISASAKILDALAQVDIEKLSKRARIDEESLADELL